MIKEFTGYRVRIADNPYCQLCVVSTWSSLSKLQIFFVPVSVCTHPGDRICSSIFYHQSYWYCWLIPLYWYSIPEKLYYPVKNSDGHSLKPGVSTHFLELGGSNPEVTIVEIDTCTKSAIIISDHIISQYLSVKYMKQKIRTNFVNSILPFV